MKSDTNVKSFRFLTHQDAYNEFKKLFADQQVLVANETRRRSPHVVPRRTDQAATDAVIANEFQNVPGVNAVNTPAKEVKTLLNVTKWIRWAFFVLAGVLLASSLFLIVNTIRLATFRAPPGDRGHEAGRRVELLRAGPVHGRRLRAGRDRRRIRSRASCTS